MFRDMNVHDQQPKRIPAFKSIPEDEHELEDAIKEVSFIVYGPNCKTRLPPPGADFIHAVDRKGEQLWVRRWR